MRLFLATLLIGCLYLTACDKAEELRDLNNPGIELIYPTEIAEISGDLPLCVKAIVTDDLNLRTLSWDIIDADQSIVRMHKDLVIASGRSHLIDEKIRLSEHLSGNYVFRIIAVDGSGNTTKLTVPFTFLN